MRRFLRDLDRAADRRPSLEAIRWAALLFVLAIVVALVGEPQPFSIVVAGAGALTGAFILWTDLDDT